MSEAKSGAILERQIPDIASLIRATKLQTYFVVGWAWQARNAATNRRLRPDRRLQNSSFGRPRRLDRLALLAPFRFAGLLCRLGN
jgi:hypothetical protein